MKKGFEAHGTRQANSRTERPDRIGQVGYNPAMDILYHTIITTAMLLAAPFFLIRALFSGTFRREMKERLVGWRSFPPPEDPVWVHAASVGEVKLALTLIKQLQHAMPERTVLLSTFTPTGLTVARKANLCPTFILPPDSPLFLNPLMDRIQPALLVLIEAELWPGLLRTCHQQGIPMVLLNGRMSEGSMIRYQKLHPLFSWIAEGVHFFAMRTEADARRVKKLGLAECRIGVTGNMKYDATVPPHSNGDRPNPGLIVCGSTRPGDEEILLSAIARLQPDYPSIRYVIAPRHMDRIDEVEAMIQACGFECVRHSLMKEKRNFSPFIILVDQLGVLTDYYSMGRAAFVGGGFRSEFGGQNILEPALCGIPVMYGSHMQNFEEESALLEESGGGLVLNTPDDLYPMLKFLLDNPEESQQLGRQAASAVIAERGAIDRNIKIIREALKFAPGL